MSAARRMDLAMFDPGAADKALAGLAMGELMRRRAAVEARIGVLEAKWLEVSEALERVAA